MIYTHTSIHTVTHTYMLPHTHTHTHTHTPGRRRCVGNRCRAAQAGVLSAGDTDVFGLRGDAYLTMTDVLKV